MHLLFQCSPVIKRLIQLSVELFFLLQVEHRNMSCSMKNRGPCENPDELLAKTHVSDYKDRLVTVKGFRLLKCFDKFADSIENLEVRDDDVWLCTFPKSGTTWTQEMIWCIANDLDYETAKVPLMNRFPFLDLPFVDDFVEKEKFDTHKKYSPIVLRGMEYFNELPSPRFIKTHLPFHLLPRDLREGRKTPRIVHVTRNPKDTCISYYHHVIRRGKFKGNLEQLSTLFMEDRVLFGPFWLHLSSYLDQANNLGDRILFLKFEDMKKDLASVINRTSEFLGKPKLCTVELEKLVDHLSFEKMKRSPGMQYLSGKASTGNVGEDNGFFHCGKIDQWKCKMTPEIIRKFDDWIATNLMALNIQDKMGLNSHLGYNFEV